MKNTGHLSVLVALALALAFAAPRALQAAPLPGDNKTDAKRPDPTAEQQQMRGLDEQVQEVKSDVLSIGAELNQLEEKLLYPSGTQVAVFVALVKGEMVSWLRITSTAPKNSKLCAKVACNASTSAM